jgi:hypothetical protein
MIRIWKFRDAPKHLKDLCPTGAEETWVLEVPGPMCAEVELVLQAQPSLSAVSRHKLSDGTGVFFGQLSPGAVGALGELNPKPKKKGKGSGAR